MRNKRWKLSLILLVVLIFSVILIIRYNNDPQAITEEINPFYGNMQIFISTVGTVLPENRLEIRPPISGRIEEILVREGEKVKVGEILAWMSSTERAALLDAARAQGEEILKHWQNILKPTPLIAPIDATVIVRAVEPGQTVTSSDAIIVLADRLIVKVQVDETDVGRVKHGQTAIISLDAHPQIEVKATVAHISYESKIINDIIIYEVDILPERVPQVFRSGMSANVNIIEKSKENILLIPLKAVKQNKRGNFVLLSKGIGEKPIERRVELGISDGRNIEVVSGLGAKDKIIVETQRHLGRSDRRPASSPFTPLMPRSRRR